MGLEFRVERLGFRVEGLGFRIQVWWLLFQGSVLRSQDSGLRILRLRFKC